MALSTLRYTLYGIHIPVLLALHNVQTFPEGSHERSVLLGSEPLGMCFIWRIYNLCRIEALPRGFEPNELTES